MGTNKTGIETETKKGSVPQEIKKIKTERNSRARGRSESSHCIPCDGIIKTAEEQKGKALMDFDRVHYKLLSDLKRTAENEGRESVRQRLKECIEQPEKGDVLRFLSARCQVDERWVERIEKGLDGVEAAIAENRSFIKTEGRVVPIGKVRRISKASVFHLARNSRYIAQTDEKGEMLPEKLQIVENLDDYSVYENRFLYMVLKTAESFIEARNRQIIKTENFRKTFMKIARTVETPTGKMEFRWEFSEERQNGVSENSTVRRLYELSQRVTALLQTELMRQMADLAMIRPPIVRTNVLKKDRYFREALTMYEYLSSYREKGYDIFEKETDALPIDRENAAEFALLAALQAESCLLADKEFRAAREKEWLEDEKNRMRAHSQRYMDRKTQILKQFAEGTISLDEALTDLETSEREEREEHLRVLKTLEDEMAKQQKLFFDERTKRQKESADRERQFKDLSREKEEILAHLDALRAEYGRIDPEDLSYTEKERFNELERECAYLKKLYDDQWLKTKKAIRKRVFRSGFLSLENGSKKDKKIGKTKTKREKTTSEDSENNR